MKKVSLKQWLLVAGALSLGASCQSQSTDSSKGDTQCKEKKECHEGCQEMDDDGEDELSEMLPAQTEEKASVDPAQQKEATPEKQEQATPAPSLTEAEAPFSQDPGLAPEVSLETLANIFSMETTETTETSGPAETK
jgi:hypothetical protein